MTARRNLIALTAIEGLLAVQFWFPVWMIFLLDQGFSLTTIALADGCFRVAVVISELPMGVLADRFGQRIAYLWLALLTLFTFVGAAFVQSTWQVMVIWFLWGIQWAAASGLGSAVLAELASTGRLAVGLHRAWSRVRAVSTATGAASLAFAGLLYQTDIRLPFLLTALAGGLILPLLLLLPAMPRHRVTSRSPWRTPDPRSLLPAGGAMLLGIWVLTVAWTLVILYQPLATELGIGAEGSALMYVLYAVSGVLASALLSTLPERFAPWAVGLGAVLMIGSTAAVGLWPDLGPVLWVPVIGAGFNLVWVTTEAWIGIKAPPHARSTAVSAASFLSGVVMIVTRPGMVLVAERWSAQFAFVIWAMLAVLFGGVLYLVWRLIRRLPNAAPSQPETPS
ncbi:MFS transporter [Enemella evansiae]|uniref:MFS transporter n=1 Tax=Enemella evansiae TaxID=2016499 RepID=UPI000B979C70|nr:MFS transporter [Enemella evansiae]OYO04172.1 hypothetical protein CGZ97_12460 [Enemella evansiae]